MEVYKDLVDEILKIFAKELGVLMLYNIVSEFNLIQFHFLHFSKFKIFPKAKERNILLKILINSISLLVFLLSLIPMVIIAAFYLSLYVLLGFLIALLIVLFFSLFAEINKELWGGIISLTVAGIGILVTIINYMLTSKKSFSENKRDIYIKLFEFLYSSIDGFKLGKRVSVIPDMSQVTMYASNIVLRLMSRIKQESSNLASEHQKRSIIYKTAFLIDYMRNEIKSRCNGITYFDYQFTDLRELCNGNLTESKTNTDISADKRIEVEKFRIEGILKTENEKRKTSQKNKIIKKQKTPAKDEVVLTEEK